MRKVRICLRTAIFGIATAAVAIGAGVALGHVGGSLEGSRVPTVDPVIHSAVPDGNWMFEIVSLTGTVRGLAYIVKSPGCPGTTLLEHRFRRKPSLGESFTTYLDADASPAADYCSMVNFQGSGSVTVRVTHP